MPATPAPHDFPTDLLAGQEELHRVRSALLALLKRLPWSVEPHDGFSDSSGWRRTERPASPGWSREEQAEVEELRAKERELAVFVTCHKYWEQVTGPDNVAARAALKHARGTPDESLSS